jgi:hypothetical protein
MMFCFNILPLHQKTVAHPTFYIWAFSHYAVWLNEKETGRIFYLNTTLFRDIFEARKDIQRVTTRLF